MAGTHAVLSPSSAARRLLCVGSLAACRHLPEQPATIDSASGTCTHMIAEQCLREKLDPESFLGKTMEVDGFTFTVDRDRVERVETYVNAIRHRVGRRMVEVRLDTSNVVGVPGQSGTGDCVIFNRTGREVEVHDLKDGVGKVFAWEDPGPDKPRWAGINPQLGEYGASALELADMLGEFDTVRLCIHQPRIQHYDEAVFTRDEIAAFVSYVRPLEQLAYRLWKDGTPTEVRQFLTPGETQCRWCPIRGECPARANEVLRLFPIATHAAEIDSMPDFAKRPVASLTEQQLADAMERVAEIEAWCRDVRTEALRRALAGRTVPGWKVVTGREGPRQFLDVKAAERVLSAGVKDESVLRECYTEPELRSPTQLEKVLKKKAKDAWVALQQFITRTAGAPTLVRDHDARPPLNTGSTVEFGLAPVGAEDLL